VSSVPRTGKAEKKSNGNSAAEEQRRGIRKWSDVAGYATAEQGGGLWGYNRGPRAQQRPRKRSKRSTRKGRGRLLVGQKHLSP